MRNLKIRKPTTFFDDFETRTSFPDSIRLEAELPDEMKGFDINNAVKNIKPKSFKLPEIKKITNDTNR